MPKYKNDFKKEIDTQRGIIYLKVHLPMCITGSSEEEDIGQAGICPALNQKPGKRLIFYFTVLKINQFTKCVDLLPPNGGTN